MNEGETENLSCLVYRVKTPKAEEETQMVERQANTAIVNHYSSAVRRKPSKTENAPELREPAQVQDTQIDEEDEYKDLNILLGKIECPKLREQASKHEEYLVKMSMNVQGSLKMDPYL